MCNSMGDQEIADKIKGKKATLFVMSDVCASSRQTNANKQCDNENRKMSRIRANLNKSSKPS